MSVPSSGESESINIPTPCGEVDNVVYDLGRPCDLCSDSSRRERRPESGLRRGVGRTLVGDANVSGIAEGVERMRIEEEDGEADRQRGARDAPAPMSAAEREVEVDDVEVERAEREPSRRDSTLVSVEVEYASDAKEGRERCNVQ